MAHVIRAPVLATAPRILYPELVAARVPAPEPEPVPEAPATAPPPHVCADPGRIAELELQIATLETQLAEQRLRMETWRLEEAARCANAQGEAAERGLAEGREQGAAEGQAALRHQADQLRQVLESLRRQVRDRAAECEDALVAIVFAAVCRLLGEQAAQATGIQALVHQAAAELGEHDTLRVRLHPGDMALLEGGTELAPKGMVVVADPAVGIGGCMIDSASGTLDARLETQLAALAAALGATRAARRAAGGAQP